jgi:hypothetical protein
MNKIQIEGPKKAQRKRRTRIVALPQVTASKIPHLKGSQTPPSPFWTTVKRAS